MIKTLTVRGAAVRVRDEGDPANPPVLLLHGIARSLEDWAPVQERLPAHFRTIAADLPGYGLSDRLPGPADLHSLADGVLATLDVLGETRPLHVMGNSLGGAVAMRLLCDAPARIATLTLVASAGFGHEVIINLRALAVPLLGRRLLRRFDERAARRVERSLFHDRAHATPERVAFAVQAFGRADFVAVFLETAKALGTVRGVRPAWRRDLLAAVAAHPRPTLLLWGERDLILPSAHLAAARTAFPDARWHLFPETGHMPQIERADDFARITTDFLTTSS
ncbi:alpha/beta fold hydrolase [Symbioplanes lichenis]|uniref:alpha/beta fold hydrolase n=1 Tax=Symbioplanes lichenis TaxID=1629072 RepID=UPI002738CD74|nr:alpha/beta fold hydrolase [Actinoplanes lichenis]